MRTILLQPNVRREPERDIAEVPAMLEEAGVEPAEDDLLVLPELIGGNLPTNEYVRLLATLARDLGAHIVGGSHYRHDRGVLLNEGLAMDSRGEVIARYQKSAPYHREIEHGVVGGTGAATFRVSDKTVLVMICADFWRRSSFPIGAPAPDIVVVCSYSITQRATPEMPRARWRHAAIARAYELPAFVAISDWASSAAGPLGVSCGCAGLAHPNPEHPYDLFQSVDGSVGAFKLDFPALEDLRRNLLARSFDSAGRI